MSKQPSKPLIYGILDESLHPETGRATIKIGLTDDLEERLRDLQTGHASRLRYINRIYIPKHLMSYEEDLAHNYFSDYRLEGEHFDISPEQLNGYFETRQKEYKQTEGLDGEIIINKRYHNKIRTGPPCYFYVDQQAQDMHGHNSKAVIKGIKWIDRWRPMLWPGVDESHPSFKKRNKKGESIVFISHRKHLENIEQMQYEKSKKNQSNLESFF